MGIATAIAVSGMNVASLRLQVSASNIANAISDGPLPGSPNVANFPDAYVPLHVDQTEAAGSGTRGIIASVLPSYVPTYNPATPHSDNNGLVAGPNVNLVNEIIQQLMGRFALTANAQVLRADARTTATLLDIVV
jgi:flagellar basal-body rod protein FlgC